MNLEMQGNHVSDNTSVGNAGSGAVSVYTSSTSTASVTLKKNTFSTNQSGASGMGGAVGLLGFQASPISVRMASNTFSHNRAGTQSEVRLRGRSVVVAVHHVVGPGFDVLAQQRPR